MTDRILTNDEVVAYERLAMQHGSLPRILARPCIELCVSHRLLQQRVEELEAQNEWLNDRLSHAVTYDD